MGVLTRLELGPDSRPCRFDPSALSSGFKGSSRSSRRRMRPRASASRRETWAWEMPELGCRLLLGPVEEEAEQEDPPLPGVERRGPPWRSAPARASTSSTGASPAARSSSRERKRRLRGPPFAACRRSARLAEPGRRPRGRADAGEARRRRTRLTYAGRNSLRRGSRRSTARTTASAATCARSSRSTPRRANRCAAPRRQRQVLLDQPAALGVGARSSTRAMDRCYAAREINGRISARIFRISRDERGTCLLGSC